ncbi:M16 family metallopeptidase [Laribacter hongkongensis]|uniref:Peptidase M16 domain protein n=1 Tax=Laribacter hongkongensis TaxID=168471 RepID=A0A248LEC5_9NEIS|nr:pitrilysin family protein [Laribacter hongkongensis]ASJ23067.1 peptidase M16 domain protein [Laribacter hongkongensis]MCG9041235.1 insulinase family protein [Laribacter hongkongensis]MCG9068766.1 insulinase family protein [Laribacter hongkongensis]MCG9110954.1 insulinase family protein [Laribacter hongkongensis]MCG9120208.1 insulinase family protein [Laribacter hongkongensis]
MSANRFLSWLLLAGGALMAGVAGAQPIERWTQPDGARVLFVPSHQNPIIDIRIDVDAGSRREAPERLGVAALTNRLLASGTRKHDEEALSAAWADRSMQYGASVDQDRAAIRLRLLSDAADRRQGVALLNEVLTQPVFPAAALARAKAQTVAGLRQEETSPQAVAYRQFIQAIYGRHPYANEARLTPAAVEAIGREDVRAFWQQHYRPGYMSIAIVGDLTRREAAELAQQLTRGLPRTGAPLPEVPPVPQPAAQRLSQPHVASQASVALGLPLLTRDDPDYYPLVVGNYVLGGGGFDSRLMTELRSKRGLTYGASSMLAPYTAPGEFMVSVSTRKAQADEARRVARETLEKFVADGPSAPELEQAKANIIGGFPLRYDSNKKLIEYVAAIGFYNLPLTWLDDYPRAVEQVTPEAVRDAYRRRVGLDHLVEVVVGGSNEPDRSKVEREQEQQ